MHACNIKVMASRTGQKTAVFDSAYALSKTVDLHGGLPQNYGNTFANFINVTTSNIWNFMIKKSKNLPWVPTAGYPCILSISGVTRRVNQRGNRRKRYTLSKMA